MKGSVCALAIVSVASLALLGCRNDGPEDAVAAAATGIPIGAPGAAGVRFDPPLAQTDEIGHHAPRRGLKTPLPPDPFAPPPTKPKKGAPAPLAPPQPTQGKGMQL